MSYGVVILADTSLLAKTVEAYLRRFLADRVETYYMTYRDTRLSRGLYLRTDVFILDLLARDDLGYRAEGLASGEKLLCAGKRVLILSGAACSTQALTQVYWDLGAEDRLFERVIRILERPVPPAEELECLRGQFAEYCRPAVDYHERRSQSPSTNEFSR